MIELFEILNGSLYSLIIASFHVVIDTISTVALTMLTGSLLITAPPLSVDNVMAVLKGLEGQWIQVCHAFYVPVVVQNQIEADFSSDYDRLKSLVRYWVQRDSLASWRRLIWRLEIFGFGLERVAKSIMNYAEKLTGQWAVSLLVDTQ